jgi:hypothetical protein
MQMNRNSIMDFVEIGEEKMPRANVQVTRNLSSIGILALSLALVACVGQQAMPPEPMPTPLATAQPTEVIPFDHELVEAVTRLYQMKGHLISSQKLWAQQDPMAAAHAAHPQSELFALVADDLKAKAPGHETRLEKALSLLPKLVAENITSTNEIQAAYDAAFTAIDEAVATLAGDARHDPAFVARIIAKLLEGASEEYAEAVQEDQLHNLEEYQDAYGFLQVASQLFGAIAEEIRAANVKEHAELEKAFKELHNWLPDVATPPKPLADPSLVTTTVKTARIELAEVFGFTLTEIAQEDRLAFIRERITQALQEYEKGEMDEAYELAASAYLDGFEHLEGELLGKDPKLVETLELQFKTLRDQIRAGVSLNELRAIQAEIEVNLIKVAEHLESKSK